MIVNQMKPTELNHECIEGFLNELSSESRRLMPVTDKWKDLEKQFESMMDALQQKVNEAELKWELMECKRKYIDQRMKEIETRQMRLEEEWESADAIRKEIYAKQLLAGKGSEEVRKKDISLDEALEKVKELTKRLEEFDSKEKKSVTLTSSSTVPPPPGVSPIQLCKTQSPNSLLELMRTEGEVTVDAVHPLQQTDPIIFTIEEKINVALTKAGVLCDIDVEGRLSVQDLEKKDAYIQVQVESGGNPGLFFTTHPKINEVLFESDNILRPNGEYDSFPISQSKDGADLLSWCGEIKDESALPMKISCWPYASANETCVRVEYEALSLFELQNVVISVPLPKLQELPNIKQIDGKWRYDFGKSILEWSILLIDNSNRSGSMEFVVPPVKSTSQFSPIRVQFTAASTCSGLKVVNVMPMKQVSCPKYAQRVLLQIEYI